MFEKVNYTYYSDTLGRSAVPTEADFEKYRLENELFIKGLVQDGLIEEREENGLDKAVCLCIEEDFRAAETMNGKTAVKASENINGYSYSRDMSERNKAVELNAKSTAERKFFWLKAFCNVRGRW